MMEKLDEIKEHIANQKLGDQNNVNLIDFKSERSLSVSLSETSSVKNVEENGHNGKKSESPLRLEKCIHEVNEINKELVKKLQANDGAFTLGEAEDGMYVVKFGMVNELEAVKNLASEVQLVGKEVEENSRVFQIYLC